MSGEGGGIIIGGVLLIAGLPYILAGAAIIGAAAGAVALAKVGIQAAAEHHSTKQFQVDNCSAELQELYARMNTVMHSRQQQEQAYYERMEQQMTALSQSMETAARTMKDTSRMEQELQKTRAVCARAMGETREQELARIQTETRAESEQILRSLDETMKTRAALADWTAGTAAAEANRQAVAQSILQDAAASIRLLQRLSAGSGDSVFLQQAQAMTRSWQTAADAMERGQYELAASTAQRVVSRSAALAMENAQKTAETESVRTALIARLEGLKAELETQCRITFRDETYGETAEYLDDFTQGSFERVQQEVCAMLERARTERSPAALSQLLRQTEQQLIPEANLIVDTGHEKLRRYYERLHAFEVISGYMKEQGYQMDWAQPVGDDVTQKLVVHFRDAASGNTIAVSLDEDADPEKLGRMAMEVMFYYANGRPVTEAEKQQIRDGISGALSRKGLQSALSCTGSVGGEAENRTLNNAEAVRNTEANPIFVVQQGD